MNLERYRIDGLSRRRYLGYLFVVSLVGGAIAGYLLASERTFAALATAGVFALLLAVPGTLSTRPIFDERDRRIDDRAARYVMFLVMAASVGFLAIPIVLEQFGVLQVQDWMLFVGLVLLVQVDCYVAISMVLRYRS